MSRRLSPKRAVAEFDSATAMVAATAQALRGEGFPRLGRGRFAAGAVLSAQRLPEWLRQKAYATSGWLEAVSADRLGDVDLDAIAAWAADHYPVRRYPAVAIGSSNGAAVHLYAALGVPWLPQTFLVPVRYRSDPDDAHAALNFGVRAADRLLAANPTVALHHMLDPNQDRLMARLMAYFRVKRLRLGAVYERFLAERLAPGAPVLVIRDCSRWPVTRRSVRHVFQFGAQGGMPAEEYHDGSARVAEFLARFGAARRGWDPPAPNDTAPEAEWGFAPDLLLDVRRWAGAHGHPVWELVLDQPEDLSAPTAELYREWYTDLGWPTDRLLVESFIMLDPETTLRARCIPFWTLFNVEPSLDRLADYLNQRAYAEISVALFPHGVASIGIAAIEQWRRQLHRATQTGRFVALDERRYPTDLAGLARYQSALAALYTPQTLADQPLPLTSVAPLLRQLPIGEKRPGDPGDGVGRAVERGMP